jgi:ketosteroid isomerase-like protein
MSRENIEAIKRGVEAYNRRDVDAFLEIHDPDVEWHPALQPMLGGEATVYRGHEGVREAIRDLDEAFAEHQIVIADIRDLGDQVVAIGHAHGRGKESGAETETPIGYLFDFRNGKVTRVVAFLDPNEALEAAGPRE